MPMDRSPHTQPQSDGEQLPCSTSPAKVVLSIECLTGSSKADEWTGNMLQTGDIVEELKIGRTVVKAPFKNGKSGVQRALHNSFKQKETSIRVRVRRGSEELLACIVPGEQLVGKKQYVLRAIDDPNYAVGFVDRTESECLDLQASRHSRMVSALERTPLQDGYVPYRWDRRMHEMLPVPCSSSFYSILFLPKASNRVGGTLYNDLDDTLARAHTWINASQASGVPAVLMNIQTESLLSKVSGDTASSSVNAGSLSDFSNLANTSLYGFEDYHGVDIGAMRGVRVWFSPLAGEIPIEITIMEDDSKLGFAISRTEEGFIYISSVVQSDDNCDTPSSRSGLSHLYKQAWAASRLLVVSRVSSQKVVPWMVSSEGGVRCFDTVSLSRKLSLHRHSRIPILLHVFVWDRNLNYAKDGSIQARAMSTEARPNESARAMDEVFDGADENEREMGDDRRLERDTAGEFSFRFRDFGLTDNWV